MRLAAGQVANPLINGLRSVVSDVVGSLVRGVMRPIAHVAHAVTKVGELFAERHRVLANLLLRADPFTQECLETLLDLPFATSKLGRARGVFGLERKLGLGRRRRGA